jgi:uncharacterized protein
MVAGLSHYYLWVRLVRDPGWPARYAAFGAWFLLAMVCVLLLGFLARGMPRSVAQPIAWLSYTWLGVFFMLIVSVLAFDVAKAFLFAWGSLNSVPVSPARRQLLARAIAGISALGATVLGITGVVSVASRTRVKVVPIALKNLAADCAGFSIVQLTDVHIGPTIGRTFIEEIVAQVNALSADVVVITGDLVDGSVEALREHVAPLAGLRATHGVFFVTGNHEYYADAPAWVAHLETLGIRVLRNERVDLGGIELAGVDDMSGGGFGAGHGEDLPKALRGRSTDKPLVLLAHQPRAVTRAASYGVDLQLSGHTHGGQIVPWNFLVRLQQPYVAGLFLHHATQLYVSCGTGYWGPPMRVGAPAEITHLILSPPA